MNTNFVECGKCGAYLDPDGTCMNCGKPARGKNRLIIAETELKPDSLVGSYFHGDVDHRWQGCVVAEPSPGVYLVELFSWGSGGSTNQQLVRIEDMTGWNFYDDAKWMNTNYEIRRYPWAEAERDEERAYRQDAAP